LRLAIFYVTKHLNFVCIGLNDETGPLMGEKMLDFVMGRNEIP